MYKLNLQAPDRQGEALHELAEKTGLSISELVRRMVDHCSREQILNELVPSSSGYLRIQHR